MVPFFIFYRSSAFFPVHNSSLRDGSKGTFQVDDPGNLSNIYSQGKDLVGGLVFVRGRGRGRRNQVGTRQSTGK